MDVIELSALITMAFAVGIGIQHLYDRYAPRGLYVSTRALAASAPDKIGLAVENALNRVAAQQTAQIEAAQAAMSAEAMKAETSLKMSGVRQIGIEKQDMRELQGLMVDGILGPAMQAIEAWNPDWAEKLRQVPPDMLLRFLDSPWFKANILPRIQPYIQPFQGSLGPSPSVDESSGGWAGR